MNISSTRDYQSATAIITTYNESVHQINETLASCLSQSTAFEKILLVNDGSTFFDENQLLKNTVIEIINLPKNQGISAARNKALELVNTEFVAILNVEISLFENWLERSILAFDKQEEIGIVYGKIVAKYDSLLTRWRFQFHEQKYPDYSDFTSFAPGHAVLFRKTVIDSVHGYDVRLKLVHEDGDICNRIKNKGYLIYYDPTIKAFTLQKDTFESIGKKHATRITVGRLTSVSFLSFIIILLKDQALRTIRNLIKGRFIFAIIDWRISIESLRFFFSRR